MRRAASLAAVAVTTTVVMACMACSLLVSTTGFDDGNLANGGSSGAADGGSQTDGGGPSAATDGGGGGGDAQNDASGVDSNVPINSDAASSAYGALILATPGLIGYWRLGEKPGATQASPAIPGGSPGTIHAGVTVGAPGLIANDPDTSFSFPTNDDVVFGTALYGFEGKATFSIEFWHSPTATTGYQFLVGKHADPTKLGWMVALDGNVGYALYRENMTGDGMETNFKPSVGSINHVVATFNGSLIRFYVNGQERGAAMLADTSLPATTAAFRIGKEIRGRLDEIALYDRELFVATIEQHYNAGK